MDNFKLSTSDFFNSTAPSCIRKSSIVFSDRLKSTGEYVNAINVAIGNISLPTHPAMLKRLLFIEDENLKKGVWRYTQTEGIDSVNLAFKKIIKSFLKPGIDPELFTLVDTGASHIMKLVMLGVCGRFNGINRPLVMLDPVYTNYISIAQELDREILALDRVLNADGKFSDVEIESVEKVIEEKKPSAFLIIPYDNPSGTLMTQETINKFAKICVKHSIFFISDEAYRGLYYRDDIKFAPSIWNISEEEVPGITSAKIRISIESFSKLFNACGLRMGALITDNQLFFDQARAVNTTYLCPSCIDQYIASAINEESEKDIQGWVAYLRSYYKRILNELYMGLKSLMPGLIVTQPEAAIYSMVDVRNVVKPGFDANDFVMYCAREGSVEINGVNYTLLVAPADGFYKNNNPYAKTQMRIACVLSDREMKLVPELFVKLLKEYEDKRK
ncbi:aminotransferase class I and II [Thermodesulfobium narugense DSM 14796]|uniref:Aminotransferase class I and II n=1 Tax=Thermodesulfobium narugense DSM 14796 TaxID=747365 RepID=M1E7J5_9BACT|nr:pyridoxal phosphate-dependent aminotransferase [Thermodesulfobium narugense]AEE14673.1 aminotransferase class I and II [Thermodesulfobium narugense DSM 14796]